MDADTRKYRVSGLDEFVDKRVNLVGRWRLFAQSGVEGIRAKRRGTEFRSTPTIM
jgi:hypothetical protein